MEHTTTLIAVLHILVAVLLVTVVLLQDAKGGGMGGAFGGGSSQTIFGASGAANFLVKVTRVLAVVFMFTCIGLTMILTKRAAHSVVDALPSVPAPRAAPAAPGAPGAPGAAVPSHLPTDGAGPSGK